MNRIDLYLEALGKAFGETGEIAPWPVHVSLPSIYAGDIEAVDLYSKAQKISREGEAAKILGKLHIGPSAAKALLMDVIPSLKAANPPIPKDERVWFTELMFSSIETIQYGDIFCRDDKNLLLSPEEAQRVYEQTPWIQVKSDASRELAQTFYKVSASMKSLIWSLFFYGWDDIGYEIHGPYSVRAKSGEDYQLIITDYFDLKPTLLWPEVKSFAYDNARLYALYDSKVELGVDVFIHFINEGNLLKSTRGIYLEANNTPIRTQKLASSLTENVLGQVKEQHEKVDAMSELEIIRKYIEDRWYAFRRWRWYFGEDWKPPQKALDRVEEWGIIEIPLGEGPTWEELKKAFDPRTEYVPGEPSA